MEGKESSPIYILICCEGKQTEPQYFDIVIKQRRINRGRARVKIVGDKGQHKTLVDEAVIERGKICKQFSLGPEDIETWIVCDKDDMTCTLAELEGYVAKNQMNLAFSDPRFEIFILQHFVRSSTNATGKELEAQISKHLAAKGHKSGYIKNDLVAFRNLFDNEPRLLETAIGNSKPISARGETPYTTAHILLERLLTLGLDVA